MMIIAQFNVSYGRKLITNQLAASHGGATHPKCSMTVLELHFGIDRPLGCMTPSLRSTRKITHETAAGPVNAGNLPMSYRVIRGAKTTLHFGVDFLHFDPASCILHSDSWVKSKQIMEISKSQKCRMQKANHFCILVKPLPGKAYSQNAKCRKFPNYVRGRRTRLRGPSTPELRRCCRSVPGGLS